MTSDNTPITTRKRKRIIRRDELPAARLSKPKASPPPKKKPRPNRAKAPVKPKAIAPSAIRLDNLNASLNAFESWRTFQPLALGIEKQIFQHIDKHSLSASKRVVQRLLRRHTQDARYLENLRKGVQRSNIDGSVSNLRLDKMKCV